MKQKHIRLTLATVCVAGVVGLAGCASKPTVNTTQTKRVFYVPEFYTVKPGDSLSKIAAQYGLNYVELAQLNNIDVMDKIYVNQSLRLRGSDKTQSRLVKTQAIEQAPEIQRTTVAATPKPVAKPVAPAVPVQTTKPSSQAGLGSASVTAPTVVTPVQVASGLKWVLPSKGQILTRFDLSKDVKGLRFGGQTGDPIFAAANGEVVYADDGLKEYGKLVLLRHNDGYITAYAHNSQLLVKPGDKVSAGQKIATMGNTGTSTTMLEFQVRLDGKPIDPAIVLPIN